MISRRGGTFRPVVFAFGALLLVAAGAAFTRLGVFLAAEDPLQKADVIVVLAGSVMTRPLEAADLFLAGYAPRVVLTRQNRDGGERELARRGIVFDEDVQRTRDVFRRIGIPDAAVTIPERVHDNTAAEAITVKELAARHGWRRILVVSSSYHLRRARLAFQRELSGTGAEVTMRASRYDGYEPGRWWRRRGDIRAILPEVPKLCAYVLGLGA